MRVLLIGGSGLIGSNVEKELSEHRHETCVFDTFSGNSASRGDLGGVVITGNAMSHSSLRTAFSSFRPEIVFHLADELVSTDGSYDFSNEADVCTSTTINIVKCIKYYPIKHLFFGSSSEVYGGDSKKPLKESGALGSLSFTGATKRYSEDLLFLAAKKYKFTFTSLRYFQIYGNRGLISPKHDIVSFILDYMVSGTPLYVVGPNKYVDVLSCQSASEATVVVFEGVVGGRVVDWVNVASGKPVSVRRLCSILKKRLPLYKHKIVYLPPTPGVRSQVGDVSLLESFGWGNVTSLEKDLDTLIEFRARKKT